MRSREWLTAGLCLSALSACSGEVEEKLNEVLKGTATVKIGEDEVEAACVNKEKVSVDAALLDADALGMASPEGLAKVAKAIQTGCEAVAQEKAERKENLERFGQECKKRKLDCGDDVESMRAALCARLAEELPLRGERRERGITDNARNWGCPDPGPPKLGPTGYWEIEEKGRGRRRMSTLRMDSALDDEGRFARLTIRCKGRKLEGYVAETYRLRKSRRVYGDVDGDSEKWRAAMSTDRKAIFFKRPERLVRDLKGKDKLTLKYRKADKARVERRFAIDGFEVAARELKRCL